MILIKEIFDSLSQKDFINAYVNQINKKYDDLLINVLTHPNYKFELGTNVIKIQCGYRNKCETNSYEYVKSKLQEGKSNIFPVGGYAFIEDSLFPVEHWWVYNEETNKFIEVTPFHPDAKKFVAYAGIINYDIQNKILNSNYVFDINFFKGGHIYHNYFK